MRRLTLSLAFLLAIGSACASDAGAPTPPTATPSPPLTAADMAARGPFGVGVMTLPLVDPSRPTEANRDYPGSPQREMQVEIWYPAAPSDSAETRDSAIAEDSGPFPLIVFAHGYSSFRTQSPSYMQHLASHGYVVAAPGFPSTRLDSPGGPRLYGTLDQPGDVSFMIDELLARSSQAGSALEGAIDGERIGMTGHSGGGLTAMITAYGPRRDDRIDAIAAVAPVGCLVPLDIARDVSVPAMIVGGSEDLLVGPPSIRMAYEAASRPKYFVEVVGGDHLRFGDFDATDADLGDILNRVSDGEISADVIRTAEGTGADPANCLENDVKGDELTTAARQRELLRTAVLPFFNYYLREDEAAGSFLHDTFPSLEGIRYEHIPPPKP